MTHLQNLLDFFRRYLSMELIILLLLVVGTFIIFSFFVQDIFRDYFQDYRRKEKEAVKSGETGKKKGSPKKKKKKKEKNLRVVKPSGKEKSKQSRENRK